MDRGTDLILISDAKNNSLYEMTLQALASAGDDINKIVVESNHSVTYPSATVIYPEIAFNYNAYLNIGARTGCREYIMFCNNDVLFDEDWNYNLTKELRQNNVSSASPICPEIASRLGIRYDEGALFGYDLITRFCGWAFMWTRSFYENVGGLNETFRFWCSDNVVVQQLKTHEKEHILVPSSVVWHLNNGRNTLLNIDKNLALEYTKMEVERFNKIFDTDLWLSPHFKFEY